MIIKKTLLKKVKVLSTELEKSKLKVLTLETTIEVAEKDLNIKIRKMSGTQQLKIKQSFREDQAHISLLLLCQNPGILLERLSEILPLHLPLLQFEFYHKK
jgi:hypothetical protein